MDSCANTFVELLRYTLYIKDEKVKMQFILTGIPWSYQASVKFNESMKLDDII